MTLLDAPSSLHAVTSDKLYVYAAGSSLLDDSTNDVVLYLTKLYKSGMFSSVLYPTFFRRQHEVGAGVGK